MRNRKIQRELRRAGITKEDFIESRDFCGIRNPTAKKAVDNICFKEAEAALKAMKEVHA